MFKILHLEYSVLYGLFIHLKNLHKKELNMQLDQNQFNKIKYAASLQRKIKELKDEYDKIRDELIGEYGAGMVTDLYNRPLMNVVISSPHRFDSKRFREENQALYEKYSKIQQSKIVRFNQALFSSKL